jgi:MoaA/NifB/PqqE/SkfB family radical SAM enzyme
MLGLVGTTIRSNVGTLDRPYKLNFAITYWCQSRCISCNIWQIKPKGELTIEEIRNFASRNRFFRWVELTGGEPFLRSDIVEIARTFKENNKSLYLLTFPTNSLCDAKLLEKRIREILGLGIPRIAATVSLDGYRELHDKIRGVPGNFDKAIATYKLLQELAKQHRNLYFVFGYTMTKFNSGEFRKTYEQVKKEIPDITVNSFHINLAQTSSNYYKNEGDNIKPESANVISELEWILANRRREFGPISMIENAFMKKLVYYARTGKSPMKSRSLDASLFLDSFGNVYPSIMWEKKIGNIRETNYDLAPLWHNEAAEEVRRDIKSRAEPNCWTSCEAFQAITGNVKSLII